jgi:hypothetical protein
MAFLSSNEEENLAKQIKVAIKDKLLSDFKNQQGRLVIEVDEVIIYEMTIDEMKSNRDIIVIGYIYAGARVWVGFHDGKSNDSFYLRNDKAFEFIYNTDIEKYTLNNAGEVKIFIV